MKLHNSGMNISGNSGLARVNAVVMSRGHDADMRLGFKLDVFAAFTL